jgi:Ca-activated chloride channel family protein
MTIANPLGFLGLLSLPIILALHLFRERKRSYTVSSLSLWNFLDIEVHGSRFRKIPVSWLLFLDLLIAILFSLALTRPTIALALPTRNARNVIILLDRTSSMLARDVLPDRFTQAKIQVTGVLNSLGPKDVATVLAFGAKPEEIGDTRFDNLQTILKNLDTLQAGETGNVFTETLALGTAALAPGIPAQFQVYSDGDFTYSLPENFRYPIHWYKIGNSTNNQAVLSISSLAYQQSRFQVFARLANFDQQPSKRVVTLLANNAPIDSTTIEIPASSQIAQVWDLVGSPDYVTVSLLGDDVLKEDDSASIGVRSINKVRVLWVNGIPDGSEQNDYVSNVLQRALEAIPTVDLQQIRFQEYSNYLPADLTIFQNSIPETLPENNVLIIQPPASSQNSSNTLIRVSEEKDLSASEYLQFDPANASLTDVDFSGVRWGKVFQIENTPPGLSPILEANQIPLILQGQVGNSRVTVWLIDLQSGNITKHPAFPVLLVNLIQGIQGKLFPAFIQTGEAIPLPTPTDLHSLKIMLEQTTLVQFNTNWPETWDNTLKPGPYQIQIESNSGRITSHIIGVNAGDIQESDLNPWAKIEGQLSQSSPMPTNVENTLDLFPWILGLAVALLFMEAMLAWR